MYWERAPRLAQRLQTVKGGLLTKRGSKFLMLPLNHLGSGDRSRTCDLRVAGLKPAPCLLYHISDVPVVVISMFLSALRLQLFSIEAEK